MNHKDTMDGRVHKGSEGRPAQRSSSGTTAGFGQPFFGPHSSKNLSIYLSIYIYVTIISYMTKKRTGSVNWKNGHALKRLLRCADSVAEKISVS